MIAVEHSQRRCHTILPHTPDEIPDGRMAIDEPYMLGDPIPLGDPYADSRCLAQRGASGRLWVWWTGSDYSIAPTPPRVVDNAVLVAACDPRCRVCAADDGGVMLYRFRDQSRREKVAADYIEPADVR